MRITEKSGHAYLEGDALVLEDFREHDPDVVAFVRDAQDVEAAVHRCLTMGARVLRTAGATLDGEVVEHHFEKMTSALEGTIVDFAERVDASATSLLDDEDGRLVLALRGWLAEVEGVLGATFDETSKKSVIAKLEALLERARTEQVTAVRRLLDPDVDDSPLSRWRSEIVRAVKDEGKDIESALLKLKEQLAVDHAHVEAFDQTAIKGFHFEQVVFDCLERIVTAQEDVPEHVGDTLGSDSTKLGDIVVTIDPTHTPGRVVRYVVEVKDKHLTLKKALDDLKAAMTNRDAQAGLMVFSSPGVCPTHEPFQWFDHRAIAVLDKADPNPDTLRLACLWARWTACRETDSRGESIDTGRVRALMDSARLTLKTATTIKGGHTKAKTAIDQASAHLDNLVCDLADTLDQIEAEIRGGL